MTPKEKAEELITKFMEINNVVYTIVKRRVLINIAKRNALIAVDEILDSFKLNTGIDIVGSSVLNFAIRERNYWEEVKKELELL